jgi:hypothetical protein
MISLVFHGFIDQLCHADAALNGVIDNKMQFWCDSQADAPDDLPPDEPGGTAQSGSAILLGLLIAQDTDVDMGMGKIPRSPHLNNRNHGGQTRVLDFILDNIGDGLLDFIADPV